MSRFYEADGENPAEHLYWPNLRRACRSDRGQRVLREVAEALLALPHRRLIASAIKTPDGEVCAVGAVAQHKGYELGNHWEGDQETTIELGVHIGLGRMIAWHLGFMNDNELPALDYSDHVRAKSRGTPYVWNADKQCYEYLHRSMVEVQEWSHERGRWVYRHVPASLGEWWTARGVTPEQRWRQVYRWVCEQIRWDLPVPA